MVVSNIFYFHPYLGQIPILTNIFQMGWNHQPVLVWNNVCVCVAGMPKSSDSEMIMTYNDSDSMTIFFRRDVYQPCLSTGTVFGQDFVCIYIYAFFTYVYV